MKYCKICAVQAVVKEKETEFYCAKCYLIKQKKENNYDYRKHYERKQNQSNASI
jgi:transcription initiation factor TFIIIB Brf1 subunit/transcription initiation factor TFIIB